MLALRAAWEGLEATWVTLPGSDVEHILAADRPDVWVSHKPAKGGDAGAMFAKIIERAAALKAGKVPAAEAGQRAGTKTKSARGPSEARCSTSP